MRRQGTCSALRRPVNATKSTSATSASETHRCSASSETALGYSIACHAVSSMLVIALTTLGFMRAVTENHVWWRSAVPTNAHP